MSDKHNIQNLRHCPVLDENGRVVSWKVWYEEEETTTTTMETEESDTGGGIGAVHYMPDIVPFAE